MTRDMLASMQTIYKVQKQNASAHVCYMNVQATVEEHATCNYICYVREPSHLNT